MKENITIYSRGLVACSVCALKVLTPESIEVTVNMQNPTGIDSKWFISKENFYTGEKNPHQCEQSEDRLHYLLTC